MSENSNDNIFYVYVYLDPRKPGKYKYGEYEFDYEPFYVGYGQGNRYKQHLYEAHSHQLINPLKERKIIKIEKLGLSCLIIKIKENLNSIQACNLETTMVLIIGRLDLKTGSLTNLSNGGEKGASGYKHTNKAIEKIRKSSTGRNHSINAKQKISSSRNGMIFSEKHKSNISTALSGRKLSSEHKINIGIASKIRNTYVYDIINPDGEIFTNIQNLKDFCKENGLNCNSLDYHNRVNPNKTFKGWFIKRSLK